MSGQLKRLERRGSIEDYFLSNLSILFLKTKNNREFS